MKCGWKTCMQYNQSEDRYTDNHVSCIVPRLPKVACCSLCARKINFIRVNRNAYTKIAPATYLTSLSYIIRRLSGQQPIYAQKYSPSGFQLCSRPTNHMSQGLLQNWKPQVRRKCIQCSRLSVYAGQQSSVVYAMLQSVQEAYVMLHSHLGAQLQSELQTNNVNPFHSYPLSTPMRIRVQWFSSRCGYSWYCGRG